MTQPPMNPNYQMQPQGSSGLSIASLVLGIIAIALTILLSCIPFVGPVIGGLIGFIAVILGGIAVSQKSPAAAAGKGKAKAGLILGIISLVIMGGIISAERAGINFFKGKLDEAVKKANEDRQKMDAQTQPTSSQSCLPATYSFWNLPTA
jgi:hypothetical protein